MMRLALRRAVTLLACAATVAVALFGAATAPAAAPKPVRVTVNDFYFGPGSVTIRKNGSITWVWSELNTYPHDVHLKKGPKGLKRKASYSTRTTATTEARFHKKFVTPGVYKFICTIHPTEMKLTVTVKK